MAATGMTNREIGQQLYLSARTVGSHLYRLFPKLGITSRNQLTPDFRPPGRDLLSHCPVVVSFRVVDDPAVAGRPAAFVAAG